MTVNSYSTELERLYSCQNTGLLTEGLTLGNSCSGEYIKTFTRVIYTQSLEADDLKDSDDVFQRGMDSLRVAVVSQRLQAALKCSDIALSAARIDIRLVHASPPIDKTMEAILALISMKDPNQATNGLAAIHSRQLAMEALLDKYSKNFP